MCFPTITDQDVKEMITIIITKEQTFLSENVLK